MNIELTEQQARSVAAAARVGLKVVQTGLVAGQDMNPGDTAAAYVGVDILDRAWQESTGYEEPAGPGDSTDG